MSVHLRRPDTARLEELLRKCEIDALTYEPVGVSLDPDIHTHLHRARWETVLSGADPFARGCAALRDWAIHRGSGLSVVADGALIAGTNVVMAAPLPVGFVEVACRIVAVVDEPDLFGFTYGTLSVHPELGEESFTLRRAPAGAVTFVIDAASEPAHPLARLAPPVANRLQDRACKRYLAAMERATRIS
jgi:uncharacterized protein (UPF0548 family)